MHRLGWGELNRMASTIALIDFNGVSFLQR